jgi:WD40 repeat protein
MAFAPDGMSLALLVVRREDPAAATKDKVSFRTEFEARLVVRVLGTGQTTVSDPFTASGVPAELRLTAGGRVYCAVFFGAVGRLFVWQPGSAGVETVWPLDGDGVRGLAVAPDGTRFASWGDGGAVTVREAATGRVTATLRGHDGRVLCAAFNPGGDRLASGGDDRTVRVWDLVRGAPPAVFRAHSSAVERLAFAADGSRFAAAGADGLAVCEPDRGAEARVVREAERPHLEDLAAAPGGRLAVVAGYRLGWRDAATGRPVDGPEVADCGAVASAPLGGRTAAGVGDGPILLLDEAGQKAGELRGHSGRVTGLALSRDGRRLASAGRDGTARVWDTATGRGLSLVQAGPGSPAVAISPDGAVAAVGTEGGDVVVFDAATGQARKRLSASGAAVRRLAFRPDGAMLAVVRAAGTGPEGGGLSVWAVAGGATPTVLDHPVAVTDAAFSPDGSRLVSADKAGAVRVWEPARGRLLLTLRGTSGPVSRLAFTPDGHRLLAAGGHVDPLGLRSKEAEELTVWDGTPPG